MWSLVLGQNRLLMAVLVGATAVSGVWGWGQLRYRQGWNDGRAAIELDRRRADEATRRRIRDADVGFGDHDDDLCWLARRVQPAPAGGAPCP